LVGGSCCNQDFLWFVAKAAFHPSNLQNAKNSLPQSRLYPFQQWWSKPRTPKKPLAPAHNNNNNNNNIKSLYCHSVPFPTEIMTYPELAGIFLVGGQNSPRVVRNRGPFFTVSMHLLCDSALKEITSWPLWCPSPLVYSIGWHTERPATARQRRSIPTV